MFEENLSQGFRLKKIEERRKYLIEETSKKCKNNNGFELY